MITFLCSIDHVSKYKPLRVLTLCLLGLTIFATTSRAQSPCELEKLLGGESAYLDCLAQLPEQPPTPPSAKKSATQPVRPATSRPADNLTTAPILLPTTHTYKPSELFNRVKDSVFVVVAANSYAAFQKENYSQGSAVAISTKRLWTNCHVVDDNRLIYLFQEDKIHEVRLVWRDRKADRCILEVDNLRLQHVSAIREYASLMVGEKVYTVGAPYGLEHTLGEGLVSGKRNREGVELIQTSAPIAPGSSGGGLFDEQGRLVGITTFLIQDAQAINFSIAADSFPR